MNQNGGYKREDIDAGREFDLTTNQINYVLSKQSFLCEYCIDTLTANNTLADRITDKKGHLMAVVMACVSCKSPERIRMLNVSHTANYSMILIALFIQLMRSTKMKIYIACSRNLFLKNHYLNNIC